METVPPDKPLGLHNRQRTGDGLIHPSGSDRSPGGRIRYTSQFRHGAAPSRKYDLQPGDEEGGRVETGRAGETRAEQSRNPCLQANLAVSKNWRAGRL